MSNAQGMVDSAQADAGQLQEQLVVAVTAADSSLQAGKQPQHQMVNAHLLLRQLVQLTASAATAAH